MKRKLLIVFAAILVTVGSVRAGWIGTDASGNYFDTANWANGIIDNVFDVELTQDQVLTADADHVLPDGLKVEVPDDYNLRFEPTDASCTWTLGGDVSVAIGNDEIGKMVTLGTNSVSRYINLNLGSEQRLFSIGAPGKLPDKTHDTLNVYGNVSNGGILKRGNGLLKIFTSSTFDGPIVVERGSVILGNGGITPFPNVASVYADGRQSEARIYAWNYNKGVNRLNPEAPIGLNGGSFILEVSNQGKAFQTNSLVRLHAGHNAVGFITVSGESYIEFSADSLQRDNDAVLGIPVSGTLGKAGNTGNAVRFFVSDYADSILPHLIGGGGAAGTTTISILPWGIANSSVSSAASAGSYDIDRGPLTYDPAVGFRTLQSATEFQTNLTVATASDNYYTLSMPSSLADNVTVNSFWYNGGGNVSMDLKGYTMTIGSGVLIQSNPYPYINIHNGVINFGSKRGYLYRSRSDSSYISATIAGTGGLTKASRGNWRLSGANTFSGSVIVAMGELLIAGGAALPDKDLLRVDVDALFGCYDASTEVVGSLSGRGTVRVGSGSLVAGVADGVAGAVVVGENGSLSPGDPSGPRQAADFTIDGNLVLTSDATLNIDLASAERNDRLVVTGSVVLGGSLEVAALGDYKPVNYESRWTIATSADGISGQFDAVTPGYQVVVEGNNMIIEKVPERAPTFILVL